MGGAMSEEDLETRVIKQQVQIIVEDVTTLIPNGNIDEQVQTHVDIGETSMVDISKIEVEL
jgi:hypothetical protein